MHKCKILATLHLKSSNWIYTSANLTRIFFSTWAFKVSYEFFMFEQGCFEFYRNILWILWKKNTLPWLTFVTLTAKTWIFLDHGQINKRFLYNEGLFRGKLVCLERRWSSPGGPWRQWRWPAATAAGSRTRIPPQPGNMESVTREHQRGVQGPYTERIDLWFEAFFCKRERRHITEWLQETKTADQWGTTLLKISYKTAK